MKLVDTNARKMTALGGAHRTFTLFQKSGVEHKQQFLNTGFKCIKSAHDQAVSSEPVVQLILALPAQHQ